MAAAKFVVSLKGLILSPKYAPLITAPAVIASENPKAFPTPSSAMPTVAMVLQELPEATETIAHIIVVATKKMEGLSNFNPKTIRVGIIPLISQAPDSEPISSSIKMAEVVFEILELTFSKILEYGIFKESPIITPTAAAVSNAN